VAEQHGIPMSCHPCASPSLTDKGLKWFWRTGPNDNSMIGNIFTFFKEWPERGGPTDLKTMALFSCDNLLCQDGRKIVLDQAAKNPSWQKVNEIYKKYSNGQNMGELAMRQFTGTIWIADTINRAGSTEPAALQKAANETNSPPDQLIIDYKGIKFGSNGQNE